MIEVSPCEGIDRITSVFVNLRERVVICVYRDPAEFLEISVAEARVLAEDLRRAAAIVDPNMD